MPCNVQTDGEMEVVFGEIARRRGRLGFTFDSIAYSPTGDLHGRSVDHSSDR